jgi:hypothetical protein
MTDIDYKLISEIIFTNDTTFTDIDIKNAKIIARVCKLARFNKNIILSFDNFKIDKYYKQIKYLSEKKTKKDVEKYEIPLDERLGAMDLDINIKYKAKIYNIIINLLKENNYIIEGVKKKMVIEQKNNIKKYVSKLKKMYVFISDIGVDINNITDDERDSLNDYVEYFEVKWDMTEIMTIFKYNSYFINMLSVNLVNEKVVIDFISSEYFTKRWRKIPIIFPKSLLENLSLNLVHDY